MFSKLCPLCPRNIWGESVRKDTVLYLNASSFSYLVFLVEMILPLFYSRHLSRTRECNVESFANGANALKIGNGQRLTVKDRQRSLPRQSTVFVFCLYSEFLCQAVFPT